MEVNELLENSLENCCMWYMHTCSCVCCLRYTVLYYTCDNHQLKTITDRMVKSLDFDINGFFSEIDRSLEASRRVFQRLDSIMLSLTEADWLRIEAKVVYAVCSASPIRL